MMSLCAWLLFTSGPAFAFAEAPPAPRVVVKLASLTPTGSVWDKAFKQMGADLKRVTDGEVQLRIYAQGTAGDEPDILRKMRIGQLHAAMLTVSGLGDIDPAFKVFEIPMFFESLAEVEHVLTKLTPMLRERLAERGFVLVNWSHAGWIHLFSTQPVKEPDDLRKLKQFSWGGDNRMAAWWRENGFQPVGLSATDIPTALETGMLEAVPAPPLTVVALQWFRSLPYMLDMGAIPYLGAMVFTEKSWKKIPAQHQDQILEIARGVEVSLQKDVPEHERRAIEEMQKRGLKVTNGPSRIPWQSLADSFAARMREERIPADFFDFAKAERDAFRSRSREGGGSD
jgi:TRAP-type C4-dicarboxylate transport system substrate-binding protein